MKKAIVLTLALLLVMAMAIPGYAAGVSSPTGTQKPAIVGEDQGNVLHDAQEVAQNLSEEKQEVFKESYESLKDMDAVVEGMSEESKQALQEQLGDEELTAESLTVVQLVYFETADDTTGPQDVKLDVSSVVSQVIGEGKTLEDLTEEELAEVLSNLVVMQYIDGEWVVMPVEVAEDGTIIVKGMVDGPVAICTL